MKTATTVLALLACTLPLAAQQSPGEPPFQACKPGDFTIIGYPDEFAPKRDSRFDVLIGDDFFGNFLIADKDWIPEIRRTIEQWNNQPGSDWTFTARGLTGETPTPFDGVTTIAPCGGIGFPCIDPAEPPEGTDPPFDPTEPRPPTVVPARQFTLAVALVFNGNRGDRAITDSDVFFNVLAPFSASPRGDQVDFESVLLHELGHVLGLNHNDNCASFPSVMESLIDTGVTNRELNPPEVAGVRFLYPDSSTPGVSLFESDRNPAFQATEGGPPLTPRTVRIFGPNASRWDASVSGGSFVRIEPDSGVFGLDDEIEILIEPEGLAAGDHAATISLTRTDHDGPPNTIEISLSVKPSAGQTAPLLTQAGVVNGANNLSRRLAPGGLFTLFGERLADFNERAQSTPLPETLGGARVFINAVPAPLLFASPAQINGQVPAEVTGSQEFRGGVVVRTSGGQTLSVPVEITEAAPEPFFTQGDEIIALNQDGTINSEENPASQGSTAVIFLTGIGPVDPPLRSGRAAPVRPLSEAALPSSVRIGGQEAEVRFLGLTPAFVGLAQANVVVPSGLSGRLAAAVTIGGQTSTSGFLWVR